ATPTVSITSPANNTSTNTAALPVTGTASDSGSGVQKVEVSLDGDPFSLATGTTNWSFTTSSLSNGIHKILARATDSAGNVGISYSTNTVVGSQISVGTQPRGTAFDSANGNLYVANIGSNSVCVINGATNTILGSPISVGSNPSGIAFDSANGNLYVANQGSNSVSVINGATNTILGSPISVGTQPRGIAFDSANGNLYVA